MKKFTKFFMFLLVAVLGLFAFACNKDTDKLDDGGETKPEIPAELKTAIDYVDALYRDKAGVTTSDWTVIAKSTGLDVVWTVTVTQGQAGDVVLTLNDEGTQYTIDVNEKTEAEIKYTLKATITNADGKSVTKEYTFSVPAFKELTYAEYMAAAKGDTVTIKGVVTAVIGKANGNSYNCLYLQDADGGYYAYGLKEDPSAAGDNQVKAGMTVRVTGIKDIYSGTIEVKEGAYEILDSTLKTVEAVDYTAAYAAAKSLKDEALVGKQSILVKIDNVTILPEDDDIASGYYKFEVGVLQSYARISSSVCPLSKADQDTFKASHKAGYKATVTGVVCVYDGAFYLTPVDANAFSNLQLPTLSDADAVAAEKALLTAPVAAVTDDCVVELPTTGAAYKEQVAITWASNNECAVVAADSSKVTFTLPAEETTVTLTATLKAGDATDTVTFEVKVDAAESAQYIAKKVETVVPGTYKFAMDQTGATGGKFLYADGGLNDKGALTSTEKASKAADFVLAAVDGKENTFTIKLGDKFLVAYRNGNYNNMKLADEAGEWVLDATLGVLTATISYEKDGAATTAVVYFGSYDNKGKIGDTFALSETKYISGDNASKIGVSQFPAYLYTLQESELVATKLATMAAGTYKIGMDQSGVEGYGMLYADGGLNDKGALTSTDKLAKAADFVIAAVEGKENTYTIKLGDKFLVAYRNGNYNNMKLDDAAGEWVFDATLGVLTATISYEKDGAAQTAVVYFGSYDNKGKVGNTFALSETKYISGDNASKIGVSQFPGYLYVAELKPIGGGNEEPPVEDVKSAFTAEKVEGELALLDAAFVKDFNAAAGTEFDSMGDLDTDNCDSGVLVNFYNAEGMADKWGWIFQALSDLEGTGAHDPSAADFDIANHKPFFFANISGFFTKSLHKDTWFEYESMDFAEDANFNAIMDKYLYGQLIAKLDKELTADYNTTAGTEFDNMGDLDTDNCDSGTIETFFANEAMAAKWGWLKEAVLAVTGETETTKGLLFANINAAFTFGLHKDTWLEVDSVDFRDLNNVRKFFNVYIEANPAVNEVEWPVNESTEVLLVTAKAEGLEAGAYVTFGKARYIVGTNAFPTLEAALAVAPANTTIKVAAGTYAGATIATEGIKILGPNAGKNPVLGPRDEEAIFTNDLAVSANNVVICGIELTEKGRIKVANVDGLTLENIYVFGSLLNKGATADAGGVSTDAAFYVTASKNIVLRDSMIANDATVEWDRPMIMYGYDIENLTIVGNSFTGRYINYNDGIKIDNPAAAQFGVKGNITISDNSFAEYQQYVIWFKKYTAGTFTVQNNTFSHIGSTDNHGMVNFINFAGTAEDQVTINFSYNNIDNSKMLGRIDASDALSTNVTANFNYNVYTNNAGPTLFLNNKDAEVVVNAEYNYWDGAAADSKVANVASIDHAYTDATEVPAIGDADVESNTYTIKFDLNGGEWFEENEATYVYGHGFNAETPTKEGFEFVAWEDANGQLYTSFPASLKKNLEVKAVWKAAE